MSYKRVIQPCEAEIVEKKSRFIARLYPVTGEDQVKELIASLKKEHHQARHHCSAFRLCDSQKTERYSDDGEPGGTAGMPMLEVLRGEEVENVLAVVIRYFGGTKLGTGGLVRAYTSAVQEVMAEADIVEVGSFVRLSLEVAYDLAGKVEYHLNSHSYILDDTNYGEKVTYSIYLDENQAEKEEQIFIELTNGHCHIASEEPVEGYISDGRLVVE